MAGPTRSVDEDEGINEINIIPLVDIMLVLLIIFMVTAQFLREQPPEADPGIEVELPAAATGGAVSESLLSITINKAGEIFLNGRLATYDDLQAAVGAAGKPPSELEALIAADKDITHGSVVGVIDYMRKLGVERFAINTKPQDID
jgi:biopolymer transport protein ExbD